MKADEALPDHLRCNRTDGRQWRCNRPVMEDKKLCEIHYLQGKHRQHKEKVPESLKIQRRTGKSEGKVPALHNLKIRAQKIEKPGRRAVRLRRKNLARDLVRIVVKREAEKRREAEGSGGEDMMRRLPNGVMVISQSAARRQQSGGASANDNVGSQCDVKVGVDANVAPRRRFRSKNLEPLPIGAVQVGTMCVVCFCCPPWFCFSVWSFLRLFLIHSCLVISRLCHIRGMWRKSGGRSVTGVKAAMPRV